MELWHLQLAALEPAEAHVAVHLGDEVLIDEIVPIPSPADVLSRTFMADFEAPANTPVVIHLHNHGYNSWRFGEMAVSHR